MEMVKIDLIWCCYGYLTFKDMKCPLMKIVEYKLYFEKLETFSFKTIPNLIKLNVF